MAGLCDADELMKTAVAATLDALTLDDKDAAAKKLARQYADVIDAAANDKERAWVMRWIAPQLLDCLESLGATPAARARLKSGGKPADARPGTLAQLRAAHRA
jgi:hypothetical protein